ncbi:MFS transporter [Mycobacteroides abscessus]|uniref:MFS transporter n=1 Tax=Mycobacteroides abscessus TaxID=36809 RepID=UPI0009A8D3F0|nr:MFS transporter [Mycobacteroides abscessus]SKF69873.1 EmrB/QacA family drug resistance transporter [Mycobacteroides abscessus subsp. bolletii]SKF74317.1 EmrB/QacA family drug resistance transporter [Mycobacteroides abscessus subsp. bolletii]SKH26028.1 EmrB/QacA family drug resistance transporter [Mycobacteroides abscessus subsp. bolletii]SKH49744.1 EmrB/QacA family drug resistance transporter [Mycobacteroides abscessus subsp. bolletii]SKH60525.1 EmrB/QacA family drug resistance transporter 
MEAAVGALSECRKIVILGSCCLSLLIVSMDSTIVNVALPTIRADFGATTSQLQWVIDIYTLGLASLLMLSGAAGDRLGRRKVFHIGLSIFAIGSLLCSVAPTVGLLIAARLLQAVGGSMLNPVALSIISQVFTGRVERARALGFWGAVVGISMALGPIVGGMLIQWVGWRAVFWINLPVCVLAFVLTAIFVPETKSATMRDVDPVGQALAVLFLFGIVFALIEGPSLGWATPGLIVVLAVALAAFAVFLRYESRRRHPFIDLRFFRSIPFASATLTAICACMAWSAFLFTMSLYLQGQRHFSAMHTGLIYLPIAVGALVFSPISGRMVGRFGARPSLFAAGTLFLTASLLLTRVSEATPIWELLVTFAIFGAGFAMVNAPITNAAVSGMPLDRAGAASAVTSTSRQVGVSIGVALCGSIGAPALWFMCAGLGLLIATLGIVSTSPVAVRSAQRLAPLIEGTTAREMSRVG